MNLGSDTVTFSMEALIARLEPAALAEGVWTPRLVSRGARLMEQGAPGGTVHVLLRGLVKLAYLTPEGDEWIKSFVPDRGLFGSLDPGAANRFAAVTIERSLVASLPSRWIGTRLAADPLLQAEAARFNAWLLDRKQAREEALLCLSVEERYRAFLSQEPQLAVRLPQGDIARYLRVTPIAFSRIKLRLRARNDGQSFFETASGATGVR